MGPDVCFTCPWRFAWAYARARWRNRHRCDGWHPPGEEDT